MYDANDNFIRETDNVTAFNANTTAGTGYFQSFSGNGVLTAFTTSQTLGTDEKVIYVWVDAGAGKGYEIQNPSAYTISGTTLTFASAPASGTNNIYVSSPNTFVNAASSAAAAADASATAAAASAASAAASSAANLQGTSTTSLAIGTGSKVFTTQAGLAFTVGRFVLVVSAADPANYMHGQITDYSGTSLTVNVTNTGGTGTLNDWNITVSGTQGPQGPAGNITNIASQPVATITASDIIIFADVDDSNNSKQDTVQGILDLVPAGVLEKVSTTTFSGAATFDVALAAGYDYKISLRNVKPSTDDVVLMCRTSSDGGSSFDSGSSDYAGGFTGIRENGTIDSRSYSAAATADITNSGVGSASDECINVILNSINHDSGVNQKHFFAEISMNDPASGTLRNLDGSFVRRSATAVDAIRFYFASGTIASGQATVYRIAR